MMTNDQVHHDYAQAFGRPWFTVAPRTTLTVVRQVVAIVRDLMLIVIMLALIILGGSVVKAVGDVRNQVDTTVPAVAPLPDDACGGGVC